MAFEVPTHRNKWPNTKSYKSNSINTMQTWWK